MKVKFTYTDHNTNEIEEFNSIQEFLDAKDINQPLFGGFFSQGREDYQQTITIDVHDEPVKCKIVVQTIK